MPRVLKIILALLFAFTLLLIYLMFMPTDDDATTQEILTQSSFTEPGIIDALVIDNDENVGVNLNDVLQGQDVMLLYIPAREATADAAINYYLFNDLSSLVKYDSNQGGYIDSTDPVYDELYLASLDIDEKEMRYIAAEKIGVRAILFNAEFLIAEQKDDPQRFQVPAATVVMADNSRWQLRVVPIRTQIFSDLNLILLD